MTSTFTYDHTGERLSTTTDTRTIADLVDRANPTGYSQILNRTDSLGQYSFTNIIGDDILAQDDGTLNHLLSDGHGSTRLLYSTSILQTYDYDAYGNAIGFDQSNAGTNYLYTGEQADLALGDSYYLRARYYVPGPGMFTSMDPYFGDAGEPQSLHKYAYVHGDPVNAWDPSGMFTVTELQFNLTTQLSRIAGLFRTINSIERTVDSIRTAFEIINFLQSGILTTIQLYFNTISHQWRNVPPRWQTRLLFEDRFWRAAAEVLTDQIPIIVSKVLGSV